MIEKQVRGDVLTSGHQHIVFAVNTEGYNDSGFAGLVSGKYWPKLAMIGDQPLGRVLEHSVNGRTFHAIVCHSLGLKGWDQAPKAIFEGLDQIMVGQNETIGAVMMGAGMIGQMQGADVAANLKAIEQSKHKVVVYSL
jgi:hypothetical protein